MTTPIHHLEGISERFDRKFVNLMSIVIPGDKENHKLVERTKDVESHILTEYLTFIDGMIEEVEGMRRIRGKEPYLWTMTYNTPTLIGAYDEHHRIDGHYQALLEILSSLKKYKEEMSKQIQR